ncbi:hypothetical protein ASZ90_017409 [hydrocarbon metagenome]|uniref:DUF155 domain-containing protein n=1 Tax=hydrocarbon metagenome TaxID=938273 RepID=A0A0W8E997_9ZZZZ
MYAMHFYRIYESSGLFDLNQLEVSLPGSGHSYSRTGLSRVKTKSIQMEVLPLLLRLGTGSVEKDGYLLEMEVQARIYDIGAISICLSYINRNEDKSNLEELALIFAGQEGMEALFEEKLRIIHSVLKVCVADLIMDSEFYEDYTIYYINQPSEIDDPVSLLMGEKAEFSSLIKEQVLSNRLSYSTDDYVILTWDTALICDPESANDLRDLIEFANVQLLELRYYDNELSKNMDKMYVDIEIAEKKSRFSRTRQYRKIISAQMELIADLTEVTEKIGNLIKITEDVYYARVYQTALKVLRTAQWNESVERKLQVIQRNYALLSNEVDVRHSYFLEWIIIILIALEFGFAILEAVLR